MPLYTQISPSWIPLMGPVSNCGSSIVEVSAVCSLLHVNVVKARTSSRKMQTYAKNVLPLIATSLVVSPPDFHLLYLPQTPLPDTEMQHIGVRHRYVA
jgi:hypothetical protein